VEVNEKQVLIKPITDDPEARTNVVVLTDSGRLAFEVTVGLPETADFVLDFRLPESDETLVQNAFRKRVDEAEDKLRNAYSAKEEQLNVQAKAMAEKKVKNQVASASRALDLKRSKTDGKIQLDLLSLSQIGAKGYLRFSIHNYTGQAYRPGQVFLGIHRIKERRFARDRKEGVLEVPSECEIPALILPDQIAYGVVSFDYRPLGKHEQPFLRIDATDRARALEITGFKWFRD